MMKFFIILGALNTMMAVGTGAFWCTWFRKQII